MNLNNRYKYFVRYWLPILLWAGMIFYLSNISLTAGPEGLRISDKLMHTLEFFPLSFLLLRAFYNSKYKKAAYWFAIFFTILYGVSDEIHQLFVPGRMFDLLDVLFDSLGGILIVIFSFIKEKYLRCLFFDYDKLKK